MLSGLTQQLFRKALFSVGTARGPERPLSPVEVSNVFHSALQAGASRNAIAKTFQLNSTMVARFLRLLDLPSEIHHLIDWGKSKQSAIGFSTASELCRAPRIEQSALAAAILKYGATKDETISIIQLRNRSREPLGICISRVIGRRPTVRLFQVVVGAITSSVLHKKLAALPQLERDKALETLLRSIYPQMQRYSAKLGESQFTIVGQQSVAENIARDGTFESKVNTGLSDALANGAALKGAL